MSLRLRARWLAATWVAAAILGTGCAPTAWNRDTAPSPTDSLHVTESVLPNGMRLVISEDHRVPVVKVTTVVGVGSADEPPGRGGFAHLFEHLMFSGTTAVPNFDVTMEAVGGATTCGPTSTRPCTTRRRRPMASTRCCGWKQTGLPTWVHLSAKKRSTFNVTSYSTRCVSPSSTNRAARRTKRPAAHCSQSRIRTFGPSLVRLRICKRPPEPTSWISSPLLHPLQPHADCGRRR